MNERELDRTSRNADEGNNFELSDEDINGDRRSQAVYSRPYDNTWVIQDTTRLAHDGDFSSDATPPGWGGRERSPAGGRADLTLPSRGVTMSYNETETHKKRRIAHPWVFRGTASAPFVPAQDLRAHGNSLSPHPRPQSTAVLARTIGKLPKHHASASAKSRDVNSTGDLAATLLESVLASNSTLTGEVSATLAPCLSRHGQPAATLLKRKETVAWCAS